jgi:hypothetical protein
MHGIESWLGRLRQRQGKREDGVPWRTGRSSKYWSASRHSARKGVDSVVALYADDAPANELLARQL